MINKYNQSFHITDYALLYVNYPGISSKFKHIKGGDVGTTSEHIHYIHDNADMKRLVFDFGTTQYLYKMNVDMGGNQVISPSGVENKDYFELFLYLHQGFDWTNVHYIHFLVKPVGKPDTVLFGQLLDTNDFKVDSTIRFTNQIGWTDCAKLFIPFTDNDIELSIMLVRHDGISNKVDNYGYLYGYPKELTPLHFNKPFPDYITTHLSFDENQFLRINTTTKESVTLEESIRNYFSVKPGDIENINIDYTIDYSGINKKTNLFENKIYKIENYLNNFNPVVYGLDINDWIDWIDPTNNNFNIVVTTSIYCNGKSSRRVNRITADFSSIVINRPVKQPNSIISTVVEEKTIINQQIINKPVETKIIGIVQPVGIIITDKDINYSPDNVTFNNITVDSYMIIDGSGTINSSKTSDGIVYFDLSTVIKPTQDTNYRIYDATNSKLLGKGRIKVSNT